MATSAKTADVVIGPNVLMREEDGLIVLTIDPSVTLGPSSSGKSSNVATTSGNRMVTSDGLQLGLNAYRPLPKA